MRAHTHVAADHDNLVDAINGKEMTNNVKITTLESL